MFSLNDKNAVVVGGTAGIGLVVAKCYIKAGASVIICGRRDNGKIVAEEIGAYFLKLNVTDEGAFSVMLTAAEEKMGKLDIVVLNAGVPGAEDLMENLSSDCVKDTLDVNVNGVYYGLKYAPVHMNDKGSIIVTSSVSAYQGSPQSSAYAASKAAASALVRAAAIELGPRGIRVNGVAPGGIKTDMALPEEIFTTLTPLARMGDPEDLVGIYNLLASDAGAYMTGTDYVVDGGMSSGITFQTLGKILS